MVLSLMSSASSVPERAACFVRIDLADKMYGPAKATFILRSSDMVKPDITMSTLPVIMHPMVREKALK